MELRDDGRQNIGNKLCHSTMGGHESRELITQSLLWVWPASIVLIVGSFYLPQPCYNMA